ncbi:hypothetical protein A0H81_14170 [Grifola frondosa]|uniref:Uncharacterized protein n=1 Tax=Grifola frondosa TaxID=5627 RepID=A0A1C7LMV4_GRIFR|nr:hypothetical protein A0H81_14170 [Grifola frondosa]
MVIRSNKGPGRIPKADYLKTLCQAAHQDENPTPNQRFENAKRDGFAAHNPEPALQDGGLRRSHLQKLNVSVLRELCDLCGLNIMATGKRQHIPKKIDYVNVLLSACSKGADTNVEEPTRHRKKRRVSISDNEEHEASVKQPRLTICIPPPPHNALSSSIITQNNIAVKRLRLTLPPPAARGVKRKKDPVSVVDEELPAEEGPPPAQRIRLSGWQRSALKAKSIRIALYAGLRDWRPMREIEHTIGPSDNVDLHVIATAFGLSKGCKVIDPKNHRPFYEYTPGYLEAANMEDMVKDGHLGIIVASDRVARFRPAIVWDPTAATIGRGTVFVTSYLSDGMRRDDGDGWIDYVADSPAIQRGDQDESMQDESMQDKIEAIIYPELALRDAERSSIHEDSPAATKTHCASCIDGSFAHIMTLVEEAVARGIERGIAAQANCHGDNLDGYKADEESHRLAPRSQKRQVLKLRAGGQHHNLFNEKFRIYLRGKGVLHEKNLPSPFLHEKNLPSPLPPSGLVTAFACGDGAGPNIAAPLVDWRSPLGSSWNREVIFLLTAEFLDEIKSDKHPPIEYDSVAMFMDRMVKTCTQKLQRTRDIYVLQLRDPAEVSSRRIEKVVKARRTETYNRQAMIIERCQPQDPEQWGAIKEIHRLLQVGGMSSDETETEGSTQSRGKRVRRVAIRLAQPELALMWKAVESYDVPFGTQLFPKRRQQVLQADCASLRTDSSRLPVQGLPINFYENHWLRSLSAREKHRLNPLCTMKIPSLYDGTHFSAPSIQKSWQKEWFQNEVVTIPPSAQTVTNLVIVWDDINFVGEFVRPKTSSEVIVFLEWVSFGGREVSVYGKEIVNLLFSVWRTGYPEAHIGHEGIPALLRPNP